MVNVALAVGTAVAIIALARALGFPALGGVFAAGLWLMNFHSMRMALLWISGRTSLVVEIGGIGRVLAPGRPGARAGANGPEAGR